MFLTYRNHYRYVLCIVSKLMKLERGREHKVARQGKEREPTARHHNCLLHFPKPAHVEQ